MPRDYEASLEDMLGALSRIRSLTEGISFTDFGTDLTTQEAVIRNLEIISDVMEVPARDRVKKRPSIVVAFP